MAVGVEEGCGVDGEAGFAQAQNEVWLLASEAGERSRSCADASAGADAAGN